MSSKAREPDRMNIGAQSQAYIELGRNEVAHRARQLWEARGRPAGRDLEYWLEAEVELLLSRQGRHRKGRWPNGSPWLGIVSSDKGR